MVLPVAIPDAHAAHSTPTKANVHKIARRPRLRVRFKETRGMDRQQKRIDNTRWAGHGNAHRFTKNEQRAHTIHVQNGLLHKKDSRTGTLTPYDTGGQGAKFVMKPSGRIISDRRDNVNGRNNFHSSLAQGKRVAAAGEMTVNNGTLTHINNDSGHYKPTQVHHNQIITELQKRGVHGFTSKVINPDNTSTTVNVP
jgi:hypothetical protein